MKYLDKNNFTLIFSFLLLSTIGYVVFSLIPMISTVFISFTSWDIIGDSKEVIGFKNYINIFTTPEFYLVMKNTFKYIILYIPTMLILSLFVSMLFNANIKEVGIFRVILFIPVLTSWVAGAMIWRTVLSTNYGLVNGILAGIGIKGPGWLTDPKWSMISIVIVSVWKDLGFFSLILFGGLKGIDKSILEASRVDGASIFDQFFKIILPLITPTLFFVLITSIINSFQLFPQIMVMTKGGPLGSTQVMVERIYNYGFRYYQMGYASSLSVLLFFMILIVTIIQFRLQKKWVYYE